VANIWFTLSVQHYSGGVVHSMVAFWFSAQYRI